jgi:acylphosphatase
MKRLIAHVLGHVQGTGYRSMVVTLARTLDLKGSVEALPDGRVFIIAEGPEEDLARFVKAVRIDDSKIKVEKILTDYRDATGEFDNFYKILSRQEMQHLPAKKTMNESGGKTPRMDQFLRAPVRLEKAGMEICRINHPLEEAASGLEQHKDEMELSREHPAREAADRSCESNKNNP